MKLKKKRPREQQFSIPLPQVSQNSSNLWNEPFVQVLLIIAVGFAVYGNTIVAPFLFDDYPYLVNNPAIKSFRYFADSSQILNLGILSDIKHNFILRPVSYFTFAVNHALHGLDVRGYHIANLLIHIGNALLVYLLFKLTLLTPAMAATSSEKDSPRPDALSYLPLFGALLFVCHPLQTQAVTYIIQRFTPLVALFYLGALTLYVHSRLASTATSRTVSYLLALIASIAAMKTKENAFTLPLVIVLYEYLFFQGANSRRLARLTPFLLTMAIIPINLMQLSSLGNSEPSETVIDSINLVNFRNVSSWDYLMTQFGVITTYLRLLILPVNQNFDYDYLLQKQFFSPAVLAPLSLLLAIAAGGVYALYCCRNRTPQQSLPLKLIAFGIFWFFITLSVESSLIPIDDLIFEHRAYLPSVGFFLTTLAGIAVAYNQQTGRSLFSSKPAILTLLAIICSLSLAGIARNLTWGDKVTFWKDVVRKSPNKARVHNHLGIALMEQSKVKLSPDILSSALKGKQLDSDEAEAAISEFRTAIKLNPKANIYYSNLGIALIEQQRYDEAANQFMTAIRMQPKNPFPRICLGQLHEEKGELTKAKEAYLAAIKQEPAFPEAHLRMGSVYEKEGNYRNALEEYETALRLFPDDSTRKKITALKSKGA
jgi:Flp pilus assembly protein TadD